MKKLILAISIITATSTFAQEKTKTFPLESMITIINNSLDEANKRLDTIELEINTAKIRLKTAYDKIGGGGFKIFVKASKKWELEKASTLTFEYKNLRKAEKKSVEFFNKKIFEKSLTNAIVNAANQWKNASSTISGLSKSSFSVEISFTIKKITKTGIEFEIWGVGIDGGIDYENTAIHTVSLTFK